MNRAFVVMLSIVLACERPAPVQEASQGADTPISERIANRTALADTTCAFERRVLHSEPAVLVDEFVRRAATGAFDHTEDWLPAAVDCIGHEPGYDMFFVLDSVRADAVFVDADSARYVLHSRELGVLGDSLNGAPTARIDTLDAYRTEFGWRLASPLFWNWLASDSERGRRWRDSLAAGRR